MDRSCKRKITIFIVIVLLTLSPAISRGASEDASVPAESHFLEGRTYLHEGNEIRASESFDKAVSIDKAYTAKVPDEYYHAGLVLIKDPKKSHIGLHYLDKYLLKRPDKGTELASLFHKEGLDMLGKNRFMANVLLERAMRLKPSYEQDEDFYFVYAVKSAHKPADMTKGGEDFLSRFPQSGRVPEVLYLMGDAYIDLRKPQEARKHFNRLSNEFPDTEWAKKAAAR